MKKKLFSFWLENKTAGLFALTPQELQGRLKAWLPTKDKDWLEYYGSEGSITAFIADKEGLNSVYHHTELKDIQETLKDVFWDYLDEITLGNTKI